MPDIFNLGSMPDRRFIKSGLQKSTLTYTGTVEEEAHKKNLSIFSNTYWKYANRTIEYHHNSDGFRCRQELDDVDWENTSVVIGCSFIYGQGIENENTISEILTHQHGEAFINAGIPGSSNRTIHSNAIEFMKRYNPKKIIILWSYPTRHTWMHLADYGDGERWESLDFMPGMDTSDRKNRIVHHGVPRAYYDYECYDTQHQWLTAIDIHSMFGNKQYYAIDKYHNNYDDVNWIKPKDMTLYELKYAHEHYDKEVTVEDLQKPEIYELINKLYGRDLTYDRVTKRLNLCHFGEQMNRDIADLIYRENFK